MICWIFIVLAHWNNSQWVEMLLHSDTWSWIWVNQSLLFLFAYKRRSKYQFYSFWFDLSGNRTHDLPPFIELQFVLIFSGVLIFLSVTCNWFVCSLVIFIVLYLWYIMNQRLMFKYGVWKHKTHIYILYIFLFGLIGKGGNVSFLFFCCFWESVILISLFRNSFALGRKRLKN
jgi:hypothetical protein